MFNLVKNNKMADNTPTNNTNTNLPPEKTFGQSVKGFFKKVLLFFIVLFIISCVGTYFYFNYTYSEGNRAGVLIKFSQKGYIFKTNEGELNLGSVNAVNGSGIVNSAWQFSVTDKNVVQQLSNLEGKMVKVHYKEKVKNLPWQGETKYFVDEVKEVK